MAPLLVRALDAHGSGAARLLVALGGPAVDPLIDAIARRDTRVLAARSLGAIGDPRARRPLQRLLQDGDRRVRAAAARALQTVSLPSPVALRISMLGRFEVLRDGQAVTDREWTTRKAKALFKLLVLHRPRASTRSRPSSGSGRARAARAGPRA